MKIKLLIVLFLLLSLPAHAAAIATIKAANGEIKYLFKDGKIMKPNGETIYTVTTDSIKQKGQTLYRFTKNEIKSPGGTTLCRFNGTEAKTPTGKTVIKYSSSDVQTTTGSTLLRLNGNTPFPVLYALGINKICK